MKIAIVGSRDFPDLKAVVDYVNSLPDDSVVVSGGALGVDKVAERAARARGLEVISIPVTEAEWRQYGKRAGPMRNAKIVEAADRVVAFQYNGSSGTQSTIDIARRFGKLEKVVTAE